jgi:hypothetical protein
MRTPAPVAWFSRLWLASMIASLLTVVATWDDLLGPDQGDASGAVAMGVAIAVGLSFGLSFLLWWLVIYRHSSTARSIMTLVSVLGIAAVAFAVAGPYLDWGVEADTRPVGWQIVENGAAIVGFFANMLLFTSGAKHWFEPNTDLAGVFS